MSQVGNDTGRFGGEFMVQDSDHMSGISQSSERTSRSGRQADQSHDGGRQQGSNDQNASRQQGGERSGRARQAH